MGRVGLVCGGASVVMSTDTDKLAAYQNRGLANAIWSYRCFTITPYKVAWQAKHCFPAFSPDIPKRFLWTAKEDKIGLCHYIDSLLLGNRSKSREYEDKGFVSDVEMYHVERPEDPVITVNIRRLVDFLLLRDHFEVPIWGKVQFVTDGKNLVPRNFIAAIMQLDPDVAETLKEERPWHPATMKDFERQKLLPAHVTTSLYRRVRGSIKAPKSEDRVTLPPTATTYSTAQLPVARPNEEAPAPQETRIALKKHEGYFDLLTQVRPDGEQAYYTRRIAKNDGSLLWCGTAYDLNGPWTVWTRDSAQLMAFGIDL